MLTLQVDSSFQVLEPANFKLQPYDQVVVRLTPEFSIVRTVEVNGQVKYPGTYALESKQVHLSQIIKMAGGLLDDADPIGSTFFRTYRNRGAISLNVGKAMNHKRNMKEDPILFEGDVVNINRLENTISIRELGTRIGQYSFLEDSLDQEIRQFVYKGSKSARWYIRNYAGGFDKEADKRSVTVTLPNDQTLSTKRFLLFRNYPNAKPGAMIALQLKPPSPEKLKPQEKVDWDNMLARLITTTTSVLTLILLLNQL
jgi:hypothetical protein